MLKTHTHLPADPLQALEVAIEFFTQHLNQALLVLFQLIYATDQGRFARTGRPADHHLLASVNIQ